MRLTTTKASLARERRLDAVVVGYNEGDFDSYRILSERAGPASPEMQIFRKEHLVVDGTAMPWLEAFSRIRAHHGGQADRYHPGEMFNLASLYLTSFLRRSGYGAEPISLFSGELAELRTLLELKPRIVVITTTFYVTLLPVVPIVEFVRETAPDARIVIGGPLIDNLCREAVDGSQVSDGLSDMLTAMDGDIYVWESQGEQTLVNLVRAMDGRDDLRRVPNLIVRDADGWIATARVPESNDLDEGSIDWSTFGAHQIGVTAQVRTARSCAFKCSFCDYPARAGALTTMSVDAVRHQLRVLAHLGVKNIVFIDDTFNVPPKRFKELCRMLVEEDLGLRWYAYFRCANAKDQETFDLAAASGCAGVFLGVESADNTVLGNMRKLTQDSQYREGIAQLKDRGITTFTALIAGFPGETEESVRITIDFVEETKPDFWRVQPWWGNPRSPIYSRAEELQIRGARYDWSHITMDSAEAAAQADRMFDAVTQSTWLPLYDMDFWSLPYLSGKGVEAEQLKGMLNASREVMQLRDAGRPSDKAQQRLEQLVLASRPAPSKYKLARSEQYTAGRDAMARPMNPVATA